MKTTRLFIVLFLLLSTRGFAQTGFWTDEGNYDVSWYNYTDTEFTINTAAQLAGLAKLAKDDALYDWDGEGVGEDGEGGRSYPITFKLGNDIDLEGHYWFPINDLRSILTFDGQNHKIHNMALNLNIDIEKFYYYGLFGEIHGDTIKNVIIGETCNIASDNSHTVGGVVGSIYRGAIENCVNNASFSSNNGSPLGGIAGIVSATSVKRCVNNGNIISGAYAGGIVGEIQLYASEIVDCINTGVISGSYYVGGILGYGYSGGQIHNCQNKGNVISSAFAGGIMGTTISDIDITYCINHADITGKTAGGIIGYHSSDTGKTGTEYCINYGTITGYNYGGGIIGYMTVSQYSHEVNNCLNEGKVTGRYAVGIIYSDDDVIVRDCLNKGYIKATKTSTESTGAFAKGIGGHYVINCGNEGRIESYSKCTGEDDRYDSSSSAGSGGIGSYYAINCYNSGNIYAYAYCTRPKDYSSAISIVTALGIGASEVLNCYNVGNIDYGTYCHAASGDEYEGIWIKTAPLSKNFVGEATIKGFFCNEGMTGCPGTYIPLSDMYLPSFIETLNNNREDYIIEKNNGKGNIVLEANEWVTDETTGLPVPFSTTPGTTGIKEISNDDTHNGAAPAGSVISRYDMSGRKLNKTARGLNIIKMSDGTVRKVFVK